MKICFSFPYILLFFCVIFSLTVPLVKGEDDNITNLSLIDAGQNNSSDSLIIADRDVVSFYINPNQDTQANLSFIIYHEAWIINNYLVPKTVTIINPIPEDKNIRISNYPAFGKRAIMGQSMISNYFNPKSVSILDKPVMYDDLNHVNYTWENVTINPHAAVIASYANYYENSSEIFSNSSINLPSAKIIRSYDSDNSSFIVNYSIANTGPLALHNPRFVLFFPYKVNDIPLVASSNLLINASCKTDVFDNTTYNDGTGKLSTGPMISSYCPEYLGNNGQFNFSIRINGDVENSGNIFPSLIVSYKEDSDLYNQTGLKTRIWPATELLSKSGVNFTRFYYYETSVAIPENQYFIIKKSSNTFFINSVQSDQNNRLLSDMVVHPPSFFSTTPTAQLPPAVTLIAIGCIGAVTLIQRKRN